MKPAKPHNPTEEAIIARIRESPVLLGDRTMQRPQGVTKRELLVGILAGGAVAAGLHPSLDIAAKACAPLFEEYAPDMRRWYPIITPTHARAAIAFAGRAHRSGALTQEEYDWICTKARKAILHGKPHHLRSLAREPIFPAAPARPQHHEEPDGPPEAA